MTIQPLAGLKQIIQDYDLVICDLWGVMHNGLKIHDPAAHAISMVRQSGAGSIFLSNAPRPRDYVRNHLQAMGLDASLTDHVVTSGGLARDEIRHRFIGSALYHIGPEDDHNTIDGLPVTLVDTPAQADVLFATGLDFPDVSAHRAYFEKPVRHGAPFLCANPDRVVHVGDKLILCAGSVADLYLQMGGNVHWFGKPVADSLLSCIKEAGFDTDTQDLSRVLMIGDSLQTDIAGARAAGVKSLLIGNGIHRGQTQALQQDMDRGLVITADHFASIFTSGETSTTSLPDYIMPSLCW